MAKQQITIPVFVPEEACPHRCIYCNQFSITGKPGIPSEREITDTIDQYCSTISPETRVELGFFGGSFTGIPLEAMTRLLDIIQPYLRDKVISSIRISTRPDYITEPILHLLREKGVGTIELGVQSMDQQVLKLANRGHSVDDTIHAVVAATDR